MLAAAGLHWASLPPLTAPWLAWIALAPLFTVLKWGTPALAIGSWGLSQALFLAMSGHWLRHFMTGAMGIAEWQAVLLVAVWCLWAALPHAVFAWLAWRYRLCESVTGILGGAALLALLVACFPVPFPADQSLTQFREPVLIQIVELGGRELLYFAMLAVNGLVFLAVDRALRRRCVPVAPVAALVGIVIAVPGFGILRLRSLDAPGAMKLEIGVVQPAVRPRGTIPRHDPFPPDYRPGDLRMRPMTRDLVDGNKGLDLVIWPELPATISYLSIARDRAQIDATVAETGVSLLFSTYEPDVTEQPDGERTLGPVGRQVAHLLDAETQELQTVTKENLVPLGEWLPLERRLPWLRAVVPSAGRTRAEGPQSPLELSSAGVRIAPLICYDEMFAATSRRFADADANLLVTLANDSWFGNNSSLDRRLATGLFRSVETRLPWVRVGNTGYTLSVDRSGEIDWDGCLPVFQRAIGVYEVTPGDPSVSFYPYTIWPVRLALAALTAWALLAARRRLFRRGSATR